jgi:rhodanese-related sulfurtransferase
MREADELQRDNGHVLPGDATPHRTMLWSPDPPTADGLRQGRASSTSAFSQGRASAREWLVWSVDRARRLVRWTRLTDSGDRPSTSEESSTVTTQPVPIKLSAAEVKRRMDSGERFAFVDARTIDEWIAWPGRIEHAVRMTVSEVAERLKALPRDRIVVTYCTFQDDEASGLVAIELARRGVVNVHPMIGGLQAWRAVGGPIEQV